MEENNLSIGELAKQLNINPKTIRYYEDIELLPRQKRGDNNYRVYVAVLFNILVYCVLCINGRLTGHCLISIGDFGSKCR